MPLDHGLVLTNESAIEQFELDVLDGDHVDLIATTWDFNRRPDSITGIAWSYPGDFDLDAKAESLRRTFGQTDRRLVIHYRISESNKTNYGPATNGEYDADWREFARTLINLGMSDSVIRPNAEFNLDWASLPQGGAANYRDAFARCVREMMSVDGADFDFIYNPAGHQIGITYEAWPVDSPMWPNGVEKPVVTPSLYDRLYLYPDSAAEIRNMSDAEFKLMVEDVWENGHLPELQMWQDFADSVGADMGTVEWGGKSLTDQHTPGDNPFYIHKMFEYMRDNGWVMQTYWNTRQNSVGEQLIWPVSESEIPNAALAWQDEVLKDYGDGGSPPAVDIDEYAIPERGTRDWHIPLNDNFTRIGRNVSSLADALGVAVTAEYALPEKGAPDWHVPLNDNFARIESDVQALAGALQNTPDVGGYTRPAKGSPNWHVPLNNNFKAIEEDLNEIVNLM